MAIFLKLMSKRGIIPGDSTVPGWQGWWFTLESASLSKQRYDTGGDGVTTQELTVSSWP